MTTEDRVGARAVNRSRQRLRVAALALAACLVVAGCGATTSPLGPGSTAAPSPVPGSATPGAVGPPIAGAPARPREPTRAATLVRVVDGDTIRVIVDGVEERVRYIGIDTPEVRPDAPATKEPYADAATDANARFLSGGRIVLERDVSERDRYGRLLADVWVERAGAWLFVNLALVAEGYARASAYPPDTRYADVLVAAERAARDAGRGLWGGKP